MHWIFQTNLYSEATMVDLERQLDAVRAVGATYSCVNLVPIFDVFVPELVDPPGLIIGMGSTSMVRVAQQRGWKPGVFFNEKFRFEAWLQGFGISNLFNGASTVCRFADLDITEDTFVRPCEDLKAFTGYVASPDEWSAWKQRVLTGEKSSYTQIGPDTMIAAAKPRPIFREYRMFVVGGKVISGSLYRTINGRQLSPDVEPEVYAFAQTMADRWSPADAYALDVAEGDTGLQVLEVNCFNGAGAYACDLVKVYGAIERLFA